MLRNIKKIGFNNRSSTVINVVIVPYMCHHSGTGATGRAAATEYEGTVDH